MHGDQTHGINDLRSFYINRRKQLDVYADKHTSKYLKSTFSYIFKSYSKEYPATLKLNKLLKNIFTGKKLDNNYLYKLFAKFSKYKKIYNNLHEYFIGSKNEKN